MDGDDTPEAFDQEYGHRTPCGQYLTFFTYVAGEECPGKSIDLGWKLEAVRGYLSNEQDQLSGWWKDISSNRASDFTTSHIDLI